MSRQKKTGAFLEKGDAFLYWSERGIFVQWVGPAENHRWGTYRTAQVWNGDGRLVTWTIDQTAQVPVL